MTADELVAVIILAAIGGSGLLYVAQRIMFGMISRKTLTSSPPNAAKQNTKIPRSHQEAEAEAGPEGREEVVPEGLAVVSLTELAIQARDAENYERGMLDAYATLLKAGWCSGTRSDMQRALASVAGQRSRLLPGLTGRAHKALAKAIAAVPAPEPVESAAPEVTPVAEREIPEGVIYRG